MRYFQLSAQGQLHRMEAGHAGAGASQPIAENLISKDKYELCDLPSCFGKKGKVGGALEDVKNDPVDEPRRPRRLAHGVRTSE